MSAEPIDFSGFTIDVDYAVLDPRGVGFYHTVKYKEVAITDFELQEASFGPFPDALAAIEAARLKMEAHISAFIATSLGL